jgi:alpha-beta hydrolase superfamily lysophospholipase
MRKPMSHEQDLSFLDVSEVLQVLFPVAYSPFFFQTASGDSSGEADLRFIEVDEGIKIGCGFWSGSKEFPSILYFHGNGETALDYSYLSNFYNQIEINLFVADYRGYGVSNGNPTVTNMLSDSHKIFERFKTIIGDEGFKESLFLMGRSLGSIPSVEIAYHYQNQLCGLIIESGTAYNFRQFWTHLESSDSDILSGDNFQNRKKIKNIEIPTCIIHGDCDQIIPVYEGLDLYSNSAAADKDIQIISDAGHNDLLALGHDQYFRTIKEFVTKHDKMLE